MSKEQINAFYKQMASDMELKKTVMAIKGDEDFIVQQMVKCAQDNGFDVDENDIKEILKENASGDFDQKILETAADVQDQEKCCAEVCGTFLGHYVGKS